MTAKRHKEKTMINHPVFFSAPTNSCYALIPPCRAKNICSPGVERPKKKKRWRRGRKPVDMFKYKARDWNTSKLYSRTWKRHVFLSLLSPLNNAALLQWPCKQDVADFFCGSSSLYDFAFKSFFFFLKHGHGLARVANQQLCALPGGCRRWFDLRRLDKREEGSDYPAKTKQKS